MNGLFDGRTLEQKILDAKKLLEEHGYLVRGPLVVKNEIKGPAKLVKFFYDKMAEHNPELLMSYAGEYSKDLSIAKNLIQSRVDLGMNTSRAIVESAQLIEALFKYEKYLGLNIRITSMFILGQDNMGWVTKKLTDIINGFHSELEEDKDQAWFDNLYQLQENNIPKDIVDYANRRLDLDDGKEKI